MKRNLGAASLLLVVFALAHCFSDARAACINVKHDGVQQFSAAALSTINGSDWNFTGNCGTTPPPPTGRISTSNIAYVPATGSVRFTSVTECSAIWGHASPFDSEIPWPPGRPNAQPTILNFTRTGYLSCHFRAPVTPNAYGWITHTEYNYGFDPTWAISTAPGDFAPLSVLCHGEASSGQNIAFYTNAPAVFRSFCGLLPGGEYYLNIKPTHPAEGTSTCPTGNVQCIFGTANAVH